MHAHTTGGFDVQTLFAYHWHTTLRLIDCAAKLDEAAYTAHPVYGHGSIHDLLFHRCAPIGAGGARSRLVISWRH